MYAKQAGARQYRDVVCTGPVVQLLLFAQYEHIFIYIKQLPALARLVHQRCFHSGRFPVDVPDRVGNFDNISPGNALFVVEERFKIIDIVLDCSEPVVVEFNYSF